jgi:hypothetical protein
MAGTAFGSDHGVWRFHDHRHAVPAPVTPTPRRVTPNPQVRTTSVEYAKALAPVARQEESAGGVNLADIAVAVNRDLDSELGRRNEVLLGRDVRPMAGCVALGSEEDLVAFVHTSARIFGHNHPASDPVRAGELARTRNLSDRAVEGKRLAARW